jgi:hypothetical protein
MRHKHRIFINIKKDVIILKKTFIYLPFFGAILPPPLARVTTLFT